MSTFFRTSVRLEGTGAPAATSPGDDLSPDPDTIVMEVGKLARLADGSATVQMGNLVVLGTAVQKKMEAFYSGRTPLTVDYRERALAVGKIAHTPTRREAMFTDTELRTSGVVHRALAPALKKSLVHDTQVLLTLLASDCEHDHVTTCINAASVALRISGASGRCG